MSDADINDVRLYAAWLLSAEMGFAHGPIEAPEGPWTCEDCPWGAKTREPYHEISNDVSEAHYICPVLGRDVWGESPECKEHQNTLMHQICKRVASEEKDSTNGR
jgi:hypothetical protein